MNRSVDPKTNVPTVATLAVAFATAVVTWGADLLPGTVPAEVVTSGQALLIAVIAIVIGKAAQTQTTPVADPSLDHHVPAEVADVPDHLEPLPDTEG